MNPLQGEGLHAWVSKTLLPSVLVKASEALSQPALEALLVPHATLARSSFRTPSKTLSLESLPFAIVSSAPPRLDEAALKRIVAENPPKEPVDFWIQRGPRDEADSKAFMELNKFPWFTAFRRSLFYSANAVEAGDTLLQPLAVVLAVRLDEPNIAQALRALAAEHAVADLPRVFVVVGDEPLTQELAASDLTPLVRLSTSNPKSGATLILQTVLDLTEKRVFALNQIASKLKGMRNALKSWFGGRPEPASAQQAAQEAAKVRSLADVLFVLRDYEGALQTYVVVRDDYMANELHLRVGSALEMMALCSFMMAKERLAEYVERAVDAYAKAKTTHPTIAPRLLTRVALLLVDAGDKSALLRMLLKASSGETDLGAALLSEQAGFALLSAGTAHVKGGLVRKFGFQMVMAGSLYRTSGLEKHAIRCLASVVNLFQDQGWPAAEQHLNLQIGSLALALKDDAIAQRFRGRVLERGLTGPVVKHHATIVKDWTESMMRLKPTALKLRLPWVMDTAAQLCEQPSVAGAMPEVHVLDQGLAKALGLGKPPKMRLAHAGEALLVSLEFRNPLLCPLPVQAMKLELAKDCHVQADDGLDLELAPLEMRRVQLCVTPTTPGEVLQVVGLKWRVMGLSTVFEHWFERKGALLNDTRAQILQRARAPDLSLSAQVALPAPFLALRCEALDPSAGPEPVGSKFRFNVHLTNTGAVPATGLIAGYASMGDGPCGLEWEPKAEVLSEHVCKLPVESLNPGQSVALGLTILAGPVPPLVVIKYSGRLAHLALPVPSGPLVRVQASVKGHPGVVSITVEDDSHSIRPLAVSCFSAAWSVESVVPALPTPWEGSSSIVLRLASRSAPGSSRVDLVQGAPESCLVREDDGFLRAAHWRALEQTRAQIKLELEAKKREMDAMGPITIQDVRRMRKQGALVTVMEDGHVTDTSLSASDMVHLCVHWLTSSGREGVSLIPRVLVPPPPRAIVHLHCADSVALRHASAVVRVKVTVKDMTGLGIQHGQLEVQSSKTFPKPTCWLGKHRQILNDVAPFGEISVVLAARVDCLGVFGLGPFVLRSQGEDFFSNEGRLVVLSPSDAVSAAAEQQLAGPDDSGNDVRWMDDTVVAAAGEEEDADAPVATPIAPESAGEVADDIAALFMDTSLGAVDGAMANTTTPVINAKKGEEGEDGSTPGTGGAPDDVDDESFLRELEKEFALRT